MLHMPNTAVERADYSRHVLYTYDYTSVLRSIHSSGELKGALRGPTTYSEPVGIMEVSYSGVSGFGICGAA